MTLQHNPSPFPLGEANEAFAKYFIGQSYLAPLVDAPEIGVHNVTFEAGCRNNWHIHHGSPQILIAVGGRGWCQFEGEPPREMKAGDVVYVPEGTKHWHGAAADGDFDHIAIMLPGDNVSTEWLEPVTDEYPAD
jgi:quercetin dioxygenase-like cupin family protein